MIDLDLFDKSEEKFRLMAKDFNNIYKRYPEEITDFGYIQLHKHQSSEVDFTVMDWRQFYLDRRVKNWYRQELEINLQQNLQKISKTAGSDKSTATQQTLATLMKYNEESSSGDNTKIFVYTHIPLTEEEEHLDNVKISKNIPEGIKAGISVFERNKGK